MLTAIIILIVIACLLLTLVVLIQNPKGGGIAANFVAPNQIMGANRSTDVVEKATWILAIVLVVLSLATNFVRPDASEGVSATESRMKDQVEGASVPATAPAPQPAPTQQPQQGQPEGQAPQGTEQPNPQPAQ